MAKQRAPFARAKLRNGALPLPRALAAAWRGKELLLYPTADRLIVQPLDGAWDRYEAKLREGQKKLSARTISAAARWAKQGRA